MYSFWTYRDFAKLNFEANDRLARYWKDQMVYIHDIGIRLQRMEQRQEVSEKMLHWGLQNAWHLSNENPGGEESTSFDTETGTYKITSTAPHSPQMMLDENDVNPYPEGQNEEDEGEWNITINSKSHSSQPTLHSFWNQ